MISFHTAKPPVPLNLDIADIFGGGAFPSQFYGKSHDGRDLYIRYRGGRLNVSIAHSPGEDAIRGQDLLTVDIGPPLDGEISLAQACTLCGITIKGEYPEETDPEAWRNTDFSGETTYWSASFETVTIETAHHLFAIAQDQFPKALCIKLEWAHDPRIIEVTAPIQTSSALLIDGPAQTHEIIIDPERGILPRPDHCLIRVGYPPWAHPKPRYSGILRPLNADISDPPFVAGMRDTPAEHAIAHERFSMRAAFPTSDTARHAQLDALGPRLLALLPMTKLSQVDLESGKQIGQTTEPLDPALAAWCAGHPHRWLSVTRDTGSGIWIGTRPAKS